MIFSKSAQSHDKYDHILQIKRKSNVKYHCRVLLVKTKVGSKQKWAKFKKLTLVLHVNSKPTSS